MLWAGPGLVLEPPVAEAAALAAELATEAAEETAELTADSTELNTELATEAASDAAEDAGADVAAAEEGTETENPAALQTPARAGATSVGWLVWSDRPRTIGATY